MSDIAKSIRPSHLALMGSNIIPQLASAFVAHAIHSPCVALVHSAFLFSLMAVPCGDRTFGNGARYHWVRQSAFVIAGTIAALCAII